MRPYLITAKLMQPSNMKRFPTPDPTHYKVSLSDHVVPFILTLSQTVLASLYHIDNVASNGINVL
jgi:hypothetical protein